MSVTRISDLPNTTRLPDGSAFSVGSFPLPDDHWLYVEGENIPPMPFQMGTDHRFRETIQENIREAARYAIRASTMNGQDTDFDPDALVNNLIVGMLGYFTPDGTYDTSDVTPVGDDAPEVQADETDKS